MADRDQAGSCRLKNAGSSRRDFWRKAAPPIPSGKMERLEAMRAAAGDELFLADLTAAMEDFSHADQDAHPA